MCIHILNARRGHTLTYFLIITYYLQTKIFFNRFVSTSLSPVYVQRAVGFQPIIIVSSFCTMRSQHATILFYDRNFIICFISRLKPLALVYIHLFYTFLNYDLRPIPPLYYYYGSIPWPRW